MGRSLLCRTGSLRKASLVLQFPSADVRVAQQHASHFRGASTKSALAATDHEQNSSFGNSTDNDVVHSRAALLVIGSEVLTGSIVDANTPWLAKLLYSRGVDFARVEVVPDDVDDIVSTLQRMRQSFGPNTAIFTSGGIGPTHDDVTYQAVAAATCTQLQVHEPTVERMRVHYAARSIELNAARLRMATLPTPSEVLVTPGLWVPLVHAHGVYVLPGIPRLFKSMVEAHLDRFQGEQFASQTLYTQQGEGDLADALTKVAAQHPTVNIGSYPNTVDAEQQKYKVKLAFSSRDPAAVAKATEAVRAAGIQIFE